MAEAIRALKLPLAIAALWMSAVAVIFAQSAGIGSISGKLTDLHSAPVEDATVVVRNRATGAEARTTTAKNGVFRFSALEPGEYSLEAASDRRGRGSVESILVNAGHDVRVQAAIAFAFPPPEPLRIAHHQLETEIAALTTAVDAHPLLAISVPGRRVPLPAWMKPVPVLLELRTTVEPGPLQALAMVGRKPVYRVDAVAVSGSAGAVMTETTVFGGQGLFSIQGLASMETAARVLQTLGKSPPVLIAQAKAAAENIGPAAVAETTTLKADQIQALPVSGRRWEEFVLDKPSAAAQTSSETEGTRRSSVREPDAVTVDGVSRGLAFGGRGLRGRGRGSSMYEPGVSETAIQEVRSTTGNVGAETARADGGQVDVQTRHGSNGLHGQGFVFDRENAWGAQNPFTQWVKETAPGTSSTTPVFTAEPYTPSDHEIIWGASIGSHIRRNKLFWFAALDGLLRNHPGVSTVRHPDEFFAQPTDNDLQVLGARLGLTGTNPLAAYSGMLESLAGLLGPASRTATQWTGFARFDWEPAERHRFTLEGTGARWNSPGGGSTRASEMYGTHSFGSSGATETWLLGRWEAFLTQNLLAVTQASVGRTIQSARPETPSEFEQGLLAGNAWGQLPQIVVDSRYGFTIGNPARYGAGSYPDEHRYLGQESIDWVHGGLLVKAGFSLSHNADATSLLRNQTGTYHYSNVENFISDALAFQMFAPGQLDVTNQHGCDQTGRVWASAQGPRGRGPLPCYSYYTQTIGPAAWRLSTNDWAAYVQTQWQAGKRLVFSAGLRWEREQLPPPIAVVDNPDLPLTQKLPRLGNGWGPRLGLAWGAGESRWPVLRVGYGMYFGRINNAVLETALTQTGSPKGDLNLFIRPTDDLPNYGGGAPAFPYVLAGLPGKVVKPGAVEFAPEFRNQEIHQGVVALEKRLPGHIDVTASAQVSLGRRLPVSIDMNFDPASNPGTITYEVKDPTGAGPIKESQITVPFYASWPSATSTPETAGRLNHNYQQITEMMSRANSTYEAAVLKVVRYGRKGLSFHARYTYSHAMDWNQNESTAVTGSDVLDPTDFRLEYGVSDWDVRHSASAMVMYQTPWKLHSAAKWLANGWMVSGTGNFHSGMPYSMRTSGSLAGEVLAGGVLVEALEPGMNGSGGDNRVYGVGRNTYRYPGAWKADLRLAKKFDLGQMREVEFLAESFNLFNHRNVTEVETIGYYIQRGSSLNDPPTLTFLDGVKEGSAAFGKPLNINATNFYRERQIQFGLRMRF